MNTLEFSRFSLLKHRRELFASGQPVVLGRRAFDVLVALIEADGALLTKDELIAKVWPGRIVEENNLQAQIATLRKVLGDDRELIRTIPGRGYHFAGEVRNTVAAKLDLPVVATNLPEGVTELIGRESVLSDVRKLFSAHRFVSLVAVGGIGKTRVALEVARRMLHSARDGVWFVDLAPVADPELVPATVATAMGLTLPGAALTTERVVAAIRNKALVLVLDNCEHVIEAAARLAEMVVLMSDATFVLATSREPLRAEGEHVYNVPPLDLPPRDDDMDENAMRSGAVRLFAARAISANPGFVPAVHAHLIGQICRHLDGIPLAIELAAARAATLGVEEVFVRLRDRFALLTGGRRTALPRHRTLRATLDWSYGLLTEPERVVFRRLGIFVGSFALDAAQAVAVDGAISPECVVDAVSHLVAKSLISADLSGSRARYRLLETTRAYALDKLAENGETECNAQRYATHFCAVAKAAESEWEQRPLKEWTAAYTYAIDDVRSALDWSFSPRGDRTVGAAMTVYSVPLWIRQSLMDECRQRVNQALASLSDVEMRCSWIAMRLFGAVAGALLYSGGPREMEDAWLKALEMAETLDDFDFQVRANWGLWIYFTTTAEHRKALQYADKFTAAIERGSNPGDHVIGERLKGVALGCMGKPAEARTHIENVLQNSRFTEVHMIRYQYDQQVATHSFLSPILWQLGYPDQAMSAACAAVNRSLELNHTLSLCHALAQGGCLVPLLVGDLVIAERHIAMLNERSAQNSLDVLGGLGSCFSGMLNVQSGDFEGGIAKLRTGIAQLARARFVLYSTIFSGALAWGLACHKDLRGARMAINDAISRCDNGDEKWMLAELLRISGEIHMLAKEEGPAESDLRHALDVARSQRTLSWELRAANSLASHLIRRKQADEARLLLMPLYDQFSEGAESIDLITASDLVAGLSMKWGAGQRLRSR
ncbi:MAG: winged helix-turn-helix domain-containing protein [Nevskia sp.]